MSCLLLKGSSENPVPPKEEVKGPEVGAAREDTKREAETIVNMEAGTPTEPSRVCGRAPARPEGCSPAPCFPPPSIDGVLWPTRGSRQTHGSGEKTQQLDGLVMRRGMGGGGSCSLPPAWGYRGFLLILQRRVPPPLPSASIRHSVRVAPDPLCATELPPRDSSPSPPHACWHSHRRLRCALVASGLAPPPASSCPGLTHAPRYPTSTISHPNHVTAATERHLERWVGRKVGGKVSMTGG